MSHYPEPVQKARTLEYRDGHITFLPTAYANPRDTYRDLLSVFAWYLKWPLKRPNVLADLIRLAVPGLHNLAVLEAANRTGVVLTTPYFIVKRESGAFAGCCPTTTFGLTRMKTRPVEVFVNSHNRGRRAALAYVHEILHVYEALTGDRLDHTLLHSIAAVLHGELIPQLTRRNIR